MRFKNWAGDQVRAAISSTTGVKTRRWLGLGTATVANHELDQIPVAGDVIVYFSDLPNKAYQLEQWLPTLEKLNEVHPVVLVFRKVPTLRYFRSRSQLPKIFVRRYDDLVNLYRFNDFKLCLYVNNGVANFQSLSAPKPLHVHINHGESDKLSMVSNQAKAYDKVFVAGPAAVERHKSVLLDFDTSRLLSVGRPQLDSIIPRQLPPFTGRTIMYAPTWEGENDANNYTSIDIFGIQIFRALVALSETRIIYKPHPRIMTSTNSGVARAHTEIMELLLALNNDGANHVAAPEGNIIALFQQVDGLLTDVSSVGLDFLYLHPEKPLLLTDREDDLARLHREVPVSRTCPVISASSIESILEAFDQTLRETSSEDRREMRRYYFGDQEPGSSTPAFIAAITALINERTRQLADYENRRSSVTSGETD